MTTLPNTNRESIAWVDLLRIVACFLVVFAHCCDPFVSQFDKNYTEFFSGTLWGSLLRPSVPLFVMISGVLLLPIKMNMGKFYARRMKRVLIPLIIWSLLLPILYYIYFSLGIKTGNPGIILENHALPAVLTRLYSFIFNFSYDTTPLWYIYMLVGLYLFMPIISAWLTQASQKDIKCFLKIWIVSMCLPYIQMFAPALGYPGNYGNMGLLGVCDWNPYGTFYYFSGFLGYLVLAYYLVRFPLNWTWGKTLAITAPIFAIGYAITSWGFLFTQTKFPGNYAALEIIWYFSGINVFMMTFSLFVIMQKIKISPSPLLSKIASLTLGIYLCHFFLVQCSYDLLYSALNIPPYLKIPVLAISTFSISLLLVWTLSKNRWTRKSIM